MRLRVMTFNLRCENDVDGENSWRNRRDAAAAAVREVCPQVVCTQEGFAHMLSYLLEALPGYSMVGRGRDADGGGEHSAIFFRSDRFEATAVDTFWLSSEPGVPGSRGWGAGLPRICTWCRLTSRETGETVRVYNAHLDHRSEEARRRSVEMIAEHVAAAREPCIVCGDFNAEPEAVEMKPLCSRASFRGGRGLLGCTDLNRGTFHGFTGTSLHAGPIDYILATPEVTLSERRVLDYPFGGKWPSDHFPVWADVTIS